MCFVFFFFQAEDGIRDIGVTGVQTCALPIWLIQQLFRGAERGRAFGMFGAVVGVSTAVGPVVGGLLLQVADWRWIDRKSVVEGKSVDLGGRRIIKKKKKKAINLLILYRISIR